MSEIIGRQIELGVGLEETRGTPQGTAEKWIKKVTANLVERSEKIIDPSTRNRLEDSLGARVVRKWSEGDVSGNVHADAIGYFLYNIYGAISSVSAGGGAYTHTFTCGQSVQHPSLTFFVKDGSAQQLVFDTGMVGSLSIEGSIDDYVKFSASIMAADAIDNSDTPSYDTEYDFIGRDITIKIADTEAGLAGATALQAKDFSINWETGLIANHVLGTYTPEDIYNAKLSIEGNVTIDFVNETYKDLFLADTYKYLQIEITGAASIGDDDNPKLKVVLHRVQIMDWNRTDETDGLSTSPIAFKAFYNEIDSKQSEVTLTNLTSEYDSAISA